MHRARQEALLLHVVAAKCKARSGRSGPGARAEELPTASTSVSRTAPDGAEEEATKLDSFATALTHSRRSLTHSLTQRLMTQDSRALALSRVLVLLAALGPGHLGLHVVGRRAVRGELRRHGLRAGLAEPGVGLAQRPQGARRVGAAA